MSDQVQSGGSSSSNGGLSIKKLIAEALGTFGLTFCACSVAVTTKCAVVPTSLAFGFVIVAMAYSIGNVSGCHINPAVSLCMLIRKKMSLSEFGGYVGAQFAGGLIGSAILGLCLRGGYNELGSNSIQEKLFNGQKKKDGWSYVDALLIEIIMTFFFLLAIKGATDSKFVSNHAGIVIGLTLALLVGFGLNLTGCSVNPARSFAPAVLEAISDKKDAIEQIWIFIVGPLIGSALSALVYGALV